MQHSHPRSKSRPIALQHIKLKCFHSSFSSAGDNIPLKKSTRSCILVFYLIFFFNFTRLLRYMQPLQCEIGSLWCRFHYCELYLPSEQSHYYGSQLKAGKSQESVSPVQQFVAETCLIPIMITKGPQLISKTNIPVLIPGWWRLCTDIETAYACGCGNESVLI